MTPKKKIVRGLLKTVSSQRVQYKPYGYELEFLGGSGLADDVGKEVFVELEIPADTVVEETEGSIVINQDGLNAILESMADSVDRLEKRYLTKLQKGEY